MKKFNIKALLVLVLSFVLVFALTACGPDDPVIEDPTVNDIFLEAVGGLDKTISSVSKLTDTFDIDLELYAIVNDAEYIVSIKGNLDISDDGNNDNNLIAIEVTKTGEEDIIFGFYYNGAEKALFVDIPGKDMARYIDNIDLFDLATMASKEEGQEYYTSFVDFCLADSEMLGGISEILFDQDDYSIVEANGKTTYTFNLPENFEISGLFLMLGNAIDVNGLIDMIFGTDGFKLSEMTIPSFSASFVIVNGPNGFEEFKIIAETKAFNFKINKNDEGEEVDALELELGIRLKTLAPKNSDGYVISLEVPSLVDNEYYEYFSPLNIETSGNLIIDDTTYSFDIKTDINPFSIEDADIYVNILSGEETYVLIRTLDGLAYVEGAAIVDDNDEPRLICISIEEAIELVKGLAKSLDSIELPDLDDFVQEADDEADKDKEEVSIDPMQIISSIMAVVKDDGLFANRKMVDEILSSMGIKVDDLKDVIEFDAEYEYDEDKIVAINGSLYMANYIPDTKDKEYTDEENYKIAVVIDYDGKYMSKVTIKVTMGDDEEVIYDGSLEVLYTTNGEENSIDGIDGFEYEHTFTGKDGEEKMVFVKLTDFRLDWGNESTIDTSEYEIDNDLYDDISEDVTVESIILKINDLLDKLFGEEKPQV